MRAILLVVAVAVAAASSGVAVVRVRETALHTALAAADATAVLPFEESARSPPLYPQTAAGTPEMVALMLVPTAAPKVLDVA